jgi:hypothetical protein
MSKHIDTLIYSMLVNVLLFGQIMFSYSDVYICDVNYPAIVLGVLYKIRGAICGDHVCLSVCDKYRRLNGLSDVHGIWYRNSLRKVKQG